MIIMPMKSNILKNFDKSSKGSAKSSVTGVSEIGIDLEQEQLSFSYDVLILTLRVYIHIMLVVEFSKDLFIIQHLRFC